MKQIFTSATKIVLLWIMFILGISTLLAVIFGLWRGSVAPLELIQILGFNSVVGFIAGYYFSNRETKGTVTSQESVKTTTESTP